MPILRDLAHEGGVKTYVQKRQQIPNVAVYAIVKPPTASRHWSVHNTRLTYIHSGAHELLVRVSGPNSTLFTRLLRIAVK
jgi:hypothetical protein